MDQRFSGVERLYGKDGFAKLQDAHVVVLGVGGVGSWTAEALARSGIRRLTLIDPDDICVSNVNRQLHAMDGQVGQDKVTALKERFALINPTCQVRAVLDLYDTSWGDEFFLETKPDVVIDAIDSVPAKVHLIVTCKRLGVPLVVCGGAAGVIDPNRIMVDDINFSHNDRLLSQVRKRLRWDHKFGGDKAPYGIPAVFSGEQARLADGMCEKELFKHHGGQGLDCDTGFGTACFITGSMGFFAAAVATRMLVQGPMAWQQ